MLDLKAISEKFGSIEMWVKIFNFPWFHVFIGKGYILINGEMNGMLNTEVGKALFEFGVARRK